MLKVTSTITLSSYEEKNLADAWLTHAEQMSFYNVIIYTDSSIGVFLWNL